MPSYYNQSPLLFQQSQELEPEQNKQQELRLEYLTKQSRINCLLKDTVESIPDAKCGLDGMKEADRILKEKGLIGILIGGLGYDLYSNQSSKEALAKLDTHKDVDVLVFTPRSKTDDPYNPPDTSKILKRFEGGVDWWHLTKVEVVQDGNDEWYQQGFWNGNGCHSFFSLRSFDRPHFISRNILDYQPGLYILPKECYENIFFAQKELELSKLYPDFEELKEYIPLEEGKKLIPQVSELFEVCEAFHNGRSTYRPFFFLDSQKFNRAWTKQHKNLKQGNAKSKQLRTKLKKAKTSEGLSPISHQRIL